MPTVTITGDSPEAVAFALMQELRGVGIARKVLSDEDALALYHRCLATVRGVAPSGTENPPATESVRGSQGYGSLGRDAAERI